MNSNYIRAVPPAERSPRVKEALVQRLMPRRAFLSRGVAVVAGLGFALATRVGLAASHTPVYLLTPVRPANDPLCVGSCATCAACHKHAENKLFASYAAADGKRAHPNCKCQIIEKSLPSTTWRLLFGNPSRPQRDAVDRRNPATQRFLRRVDI